MSSNRLTERLVALQHRDFRLLWSGQISSTVAQMMLVIALNWNVYELLRNVSSSVTLFGVSMDLSGSALGLSGLSLARVLPILLFAVPGGMLADMVNRRNLMLTTQSTNALITVILTAVSLSGRATVPTLYLIATISGVSDQRFGDATRIADTELGVHERTC